MFMGLLLSVAALFLAVYTLWGEYQAKVQSEAALGLVEEYIGSGTVAETEAEEVVTETEPEEVPVPEFLYDPTMEMPEELIDGQKYIGVVEIPDLGLTLPIISEWSDAKLKISPCRYVGSAYTNDMILSGHSYVNHFRYIRKLERGAEIIFTDMAVEYYLLTEAVTQLSYSADVGIENDTVILLNPTSANLDITNEESRNLF